MCPCPCMSTGTTKMHPHGPAYIHTATESPHFPASARPHTDRHAHTHTHTHTRMQITVPRSAKTSGWHRAVEYAHRTCKTSLPSVQAARVEKTFVSTQKRTARTTKNNMHGKKSRWRQGAAKPIRRKPNASRMWWITSRQAPMYRRILQSISTL